MFRTHSVALAFAGVVFLTPLLARAATFRDDFSSNPVARGWQAFGDTNLFSWDAAHQDLLVTWDSSQPNSYFYRSLGTLLTRNDDFSLGFDLRLASIGAGADTNKDSSFPVSVGFLDLSQASQTNFLRGTGTSSPDLAEFAYFWDSGFGATDWPTLVDTNSTFDYNSASDYALTPLTTNNWYRILMVYTASNQTLITTLTNLQSGSGVTIRTPLNPTNFTSFQLDTVAISSYNDGGQDPQFAGSVLAHGVIDNFVLTVPPPPIQSLAGNFTNGAWRAQFLSRSNWLYTLERSTNFHAWTPVSPRRSGTAANLFLEDTNQPAGQAFYRVRAEHP